MIKTKMRCIPRACYDCVYYVPATLTWNYKSSCRAATSNPDGKSINRRGSEYIEITKRRPKWCPLAEVQK